MTRYENLMEAKIPCEETGIKICHTLCDICSPSYHCGVDAYIKDDKIIKIEGMAKHPMNKGKLCTKGAANREYIYREDRIKSPMKLVGAKGSGTYEPITWEEAYKTISEKLLKYRKENGAKSVVFFSGYGKWYRPFLQRFAYSFGSPNYATESSSCFTSGLMAWKIATGMPARPDLKNAKLFLGWAHNPYYSGYLNAATTEQRKKDGCKFIIIDTLYTQTASKMADLFLQPRPGTDGALALAIANTLIENDWIDHNYIEKYVHGFPEYAEYCKQFNENTIEAITGVPYEKVYKAAEMIHEYSPMSIKESSAPLAHHVNGMQNYRAVMSLLAITGNYDKIGGQVPSNFTYIHQCSGYQTLEHKFAEETKKDDFAMPVGAERFPLWYNLEGEAQAMALLEQLQTEKPYPIKALFALGINFRMMPESKKLQDEIAKLDFFVDVDLFMTDSAKYADIILPACSSFEREEFKSYPNGYAYYTTPVIKPLYDSKPDTTIISELASHLQLDDALLCSGYRKCLEYILSPISLSIDDLQSANMPIKVPEFQAHKEMSTISKGLNTVTGKFELKSEIIASHSEWGLDPLPTYKPPYDESDKKAYPFILTSGGRLPNALHSRLHDVAWLRTLRPDAMADISTDDALSMGISFGDKIEIITAISSVTVLANPTAHVPIGTICLYHGYREANFNDLMDSNRLDPYSGFPAVRSSCCNMRRVSL